MSGNKLLLDTNIIIYFSKGSINFEQLINKYDTFYTSVISYMEVYGYNFKEKKEKEFIDELFNNLEIVEINKLIADSVIVYMKRKDKKIKIPDAVILATAKYLNADLVTDDWDDFVGFDDDVKIIKKQDL